MEDRKLQLIKTFVEWVFKDYPPIWVKGPKNQFWYEQNKFNIVWDDNYAYSFINENQIPQPHPTTYRRTALCRRHYDGIIYPHTAETKAPEHYGICGRLPDDYTFIKWIDNWTKVKDYDQ